MLIVAIGQANGQVDENDIDGNKALDISGSYGVNVCGYEAYKKFITAGWETAKDKGLYLGSLDETTLENIKMIQKVSGLPEVSFHMSGTEAVMAAVLGRAPDAAFAIALQTSAAFSATRSLISTSSSGPLSCCGWGSRGRSGGRTPKRFAGTTSRCCTGPSSTRWWRVRRPGRTSASSTRPRGTSSRPSKSSPGTRGRRSMRPLCGRRWRRRRWR